MQPYELLPRYGMCELLCQKYGDMIAGTIRRMEGTDLGQVEVIGGLP